MLAPKHVFTGPVYCCYALGGPATAARVEYADWASLRSSFWWIMLCEFACFSLTEFSSLLGNRIRDL